MVDSIAKKNSNAVVKGSNSTRAARTLLVSKYT